MNRYEVRTGCACSNDTVSDYYDDLADAERLFAGLAGLEHYNLELWDYGTLIKESTYKE